jgi:hypothetical protein
LIFSSGLTKTLTPTNTIEMPGDVFATPRRSPDELGREMRQPMAIAWYSQGLISQGKAAEIAGIDRTEFRYRLAQAKVDALSPPELPSSWLPLDEVPNIAWRRPLNRNHNLGLTPRA